MEKNKRAYVVATAHLDTVWRWTLADTIDKFIPDTLSKNFDLIEKYPDYIFNFEGAYRYELIEDFYPRAFEIIEEYIKQGNWSVAGSAYENGDVNIPAPESLIRNILIGNNYFLKKFNVKSEELFLPDCFGFGWATPSVIKHCGLIGLTTQKLSWGSAYGLPMDLGIWKGPDARAALVNLNAKSYRYKFSGDIRADLSIIDRIADNAHNADLPWANHLYGTGDQGGAPTEESVYAVEESIRKNGTGDFEVISATSDQIFRDMDALPRSEKDKFPVWGNELIMTRHGAGGYTSRAMSKRLNFLCEQIASATEPICAYAHYKNLIKYPKENLNNAWKKVLRHQFHDDITGTSIMQVYNDSWNDYTIAYSMFKNEYFNAARSLAYSVDTSWKDKDNPCILVTNSTQYNRTEPITVTAHMRHLSPAVRVFDKEGNEVPSQIIQKTGKTFKLELLATVVPYSVTPYEIRPSDKAYDTKSDLRITEHTLQNSKYIIKLNKNGDIAYIYDKELEKEIIEAPIKLALLKDTGSLAYPSWEIRKEDIDSEPYCYANSPEFTIVENGPLRITLKVKREAEYSTISQYISLTTNGKYIRVDNSVDWQTRRTMLKAVFPLAAKNKTATYDLGLGVINRENNSERLYEVPAQHWADISNIDKSFGVSVFSECKYGWDKPNDNTLRLTCIHTPSGAFTKEARQDLQDLGQNNFSFAIYSHSKGFENETQSESAKYLNPLQAIESFDSTPGAKEIKPLVRIGGDHENDIIIRAVKLCEEDDSLIIRLNEANGNIVKDVPIVTCSFIKKAEAVNGSEEFLHDLPFTANVLHVNFMPYQLMTIKLYLEHPKQYVNSEKCRPLRLPFNSKGFTDINNMRNVILQGSGLSLPLKILPKNYKVSGIFFKHSRDPKDRYDVLVCRGEEIDIPEKANYIYACRICVGNRKG